ncbi:alpha-mannosidase 2 isoform X1, partial [Fagus crenata]
TIWRFIPTLVFPPRQPAKPHRQPIPTPLLADTVAATISTIVILRYGVPRPISSHFKSRVGGGGGGGGPSRLSKPTRKPNIRKVPSNDAVLKSVVDITTK